MDIARISITLIASRLGEMIASLLYFSFIGHFIVDSLSQASLAWAFVSFLTVIGIGFFSLLMVNIAGSNNLNTSAIALDLNISLRYAILFGGLIISGVFLYAFNEWTSSATNESALGIKVVLIFSLALPAIYIQIIIFNFFNANRKTKFELLYTWTFNMAFVAVCAILVFTSRDSNIVYFVSAYVALRWLFVIAAFIFFARSIHRCIPRFRYLQSIKRKRYAEYFYKGLPLAFCFGGESCLFFILSFVSKNLGDVSLSAYQASLHLLSIVYMISIGVGNAVGIVAARHYVQKDFLLLKKTYWQGLNFGLLLLVPFLLACIFFNEHISLLYTSDAAVRRLIESNILTAIPFLIFEYVYIVTRMTLRSMGDFWIPTLFTIAFLNFLGVAFSALLLSLYEYSVRSIFIALVLCSFILMLFLTFRLRTKLKKNPDW